MGYKYIRTYTGKEFYPMDPQPEAIDIRDIAHALSLVCRGNGHVNRFFSVAQHCINCAMEAEARGYSTRVIMACLLHDASECYMSDIPRPFKKSLPEYCEKEERLLGMVYERFLGSGLSTEEERIVKEIDDAMLWYDLKILLDVETGPMPDVHIDFDYAFRPFADVEREYLEMFERYRM